MQSEYTIHLVRHGQVRNPNHIVYGDLPGFDLDATGVLQVHAAANHLAGRSVTKVVSSPLRRARHTASAIAGRHGLAPVKDMDLTEWRLAPHWFGHRWEDLDSVAPGELERYLAAPDVCEFAVETLDELATRFVTSIERHATGDGAVVFVSHQDPVAATILALSGGPLASLRRDAPEHASVTTMRQQDGGWRVIERWAPPTLQ